MLGSGFFSNNILRSAEYNQQNATFHNLFL
jgi:hypothetical protein